MNYYNDNDAFCCAWLRELIAAKLIPDGVVDSRSISEVQPEDLNGYTQCHFFAGIGGWTYALQLAGWPADKPVWTGSCPCQPFSCAGKRKGEADARHLWPAFRVLIAECRPATIFGEQVASKDAREWLAGVRADLERVGYAVGVADLCAASAGAPHIRQRLFWVADNSNPRLAGWQKQPARGECQTVERGGDAGGLDHATSDGCEVRQHVQRPDDGQRLGEGCDNGRLEQPTEHGREQRRPASSERSVVSGRGNFWSASRWHQCLDGKVRRVPVETQPRFLLLADGFWYRVADVLPEITSEAITELNDYAATHQNHASEILRMVQSTIREEAFQRKASGLSCVQETKILHAFLRDISSALEGSADYCGSKKEGSENTDRTLRDLRNLMRAQRSSYRRESEEQFDGEPSESLFKLSWILARHCEETVSCKSRANEVAFPLSGKVVGRVGMLRGAGNSIVPQVAAEFIRAYLAV